mmetsp:Transcript_8853/g.11535  ORF Transcript_8853/g.11535 Transcript_8853/m.11535 type:complete len:924 (-) Transcript_8853:1361-4132(-)
MPHDLNVANFINAFTGTDEERVEKSYALFTSALGVTLLLDVGSALVLLLSSCEWKNLSHCAISNFGNIEHGYSLKNGAAVCVVLALSRCILFPSLAYLAIKLGVEKRHLRLITPSENSGGSTANSISTSSTDGEVDPLQVRLLVEDESSSSTQSDIATGREKEAGIESAKEVSERARAQRLAILYKYSTMILIFVVSSAYQVYAGVKVSFFEWNSEETLEVVMMCISVLWINLEAFFARTLIEELTREQGLYLSDVHRHPLFKDTGLNMHRCDLCKEKIFRRSERGVGWRCRLCDFDVCTVCASREDVADVSENMLRGDKGVRVEAEISNSTYFARAISIVKPERFLFCLSLLCLLFRSAAQLALPSFSGRIINDIVESNKPGFFHDVQLYLLIMLLNGALNGLSSFLFAVIARKLVYHVRNKLFKSVVLQDVAFFDGTTSGYTISHLTYNVNLMMQPISGSLATLLQDIILLFGGVTMCYVKSYRLSMLAFITVGPIMFIWDAYAQWSKRLNSKMIAGWSEANSCANQALSHIKTVKAFSSEDLEISLYNNANLQALKAGIKSAIGSGLTTTLAGYMDLGTGVLILWFGGLLVLNESKENSTVLTVGELVAFQLYWDIMNGAYNSLQGLATSLTMSAAGAEKVFSLWDSIPDINPDEGESIDWNVQGNLKIEQVKYYYQMRPDNIVLKDVSIDIPSGSVCAFVGKSGGGKSTLMKLLMRFYDPKQGRILLDGREYTSLRVSHLRKCFGIVSQDTKLFAKSVMYNITYGMEEGTYTKAQVIAAAKKAHAHEFIEKMKDGYDTRVGEHGGRVSGGQAQRIAIARVFLRNPKIILLDEATSALDEESQQAVQDGLDALIRKGGSTIVLVAHRLSTVKFADKIVVLDKGEIAEEGSHDELMSRDGVYANLIKVKKRSEREDLSQSK